MNTFHSSLEIRKFLSPELITGVGCRRLSADYLAHFGGDKTLIVTDDQVRKQGWFIDILESLNARNLQYHIYSDISPNPRKEEVHRGAEQFLSEDCRIILTIGGGSPMDCAKGIGIVCSNERPITDFEGVDQVKIPMPPLICIPSTAGTAADLSQFSIITETDMSYKMAIVSKSIVPDLSLSDPEVLCTMDSYLTACTGVDAMVHAVEAYVSNASSSMTDALALDAISLVWKNLKKSIDEPENLHYRNAMMHGSIKAGLAFSNASLGCIHAMAHSLGGLKDLPHGECNALLLPNCVGFNYNACPERFKEIALALELEESNRESLTDRLREFLETLGIKGNLSDRGVNQREITSLASIALKDACMATNPREINQKEMEGLFGACLE